jgi:hypothetical protein
MYYVKFTEALKNLRAWCHEWFRVACHHVLGLEFRVFWGLGFRVPQMEQLL